MTSPTPIAARYGVLDLFSGIGGFSLGLERTGGFKTVAFCEIDKFCQRVLRKHWPEVPIYDDIRELTAARLAADGIVPDVLCGGFPCQDISTAGKGAGIAGERSGLWSEYARLIGEILPRFVIVENVAALLGRGLSRVLGDLASLGFDAEWHCIPASAVGAPHIRDRVWIVAYPQHPDADKQRSYREAQHNGNAECGDEQSGIAGQVGEILAHPECGEQQSESVSNRCRIGVAWQAENEWREGASAIAGRSGILAHPDTLSSEGMWTVGREGVAAQLRTREIGRSSESTSVLHPAYFAALSEGIRQGDTAGQWWSEPDVGRVAHGVPSRVDRLRSLGNTLVPIIPELIGRAILASGAVG